MNFPSGGTPSRKFRASTLYFWSGGVSKFRAVNDPSGRRVANRPADERVSVCIPVHRTVGAASQTGRLRPGLGGVYGPERYDGEICITCLQSGLGGETVKTR